MESLIEQRDYARISYDLYRRNLVGAGGLTSPWFGVKIYKHGELWADCVFKTDSEARAWAREIDNEFLRLEP